jgi:TolB protein
MGRVWRATLAVLLAAVLMAQQRPDFSGEVSKKGTLPAIAVPDFRGADDAQPLMGVFNQTLWSDLESSGLVKLIPKTSYPTVVPQQPSDLLNPRPDLERAGGRLMSDWANPPAQANYLAFGYAAAKNGVFAAFGYFFDLSQPTTRQAQVIGERYAASADEDGARKTAHAFAAAILKSFGGTSLAGTHIYFVSDRSGHKEIWAMDWDGSNQHQITHFNFIASSPAISPDGSRLMCTAYAGTGKPPRLFLYSTDPLRQVAFLNPKTDYSAHSSFSADGKQVLFDAALNNSYRIYIAAADGSNARVINSSDQVQVEPDMNPKNPNLIAFTSGRSGTPQIYTMNADGGDISRITSGIGEAYNPAWQPDGSHIAFAWTQGYEPGHLNIFIINPVDKSYVQLTREAGKNEHPSWAPDGVHLAFSSTQTGREQIWTMLADGSGLKQLTTTGVNSGPVWGQ